MTNANRFNKSARCSSSCSLLENKLSDPDCEIEATLAGKKGGKYDRILFALYNYITVYIFTYTYNLYVNISNIADGCIALEGIKGCEQKNGPP